MAKPDARWDKISYTSHFLFIHAFMSSALKAQQQRIVYVDWWKIMRWHKFMGNYAWWTCLELEIRHWKCICGIATDTMQCNTMNICLKRKLICIIVGVHSLPWCYNNKCHNTMDNVLLYFGLALTIIALFASWDQIEQMISLLFH